MFIRTKNLNFAQCHLSARHASNLLDCVNVKNWDLENVSIISGRALKKLIQLNLVNSTLAIGVYKVMMTATGFKLLEPLNFRLDQS